MLIIIIIIIILLRWFCENICNVLCSDAYKPIPVKLGMTMDITKIYSLTPV